ncbi:MAG: RimK/LysX family protein, partial [Pseudomonadota bacterium]
MTAKSRLLTHCLVVAFLLGASSPASAVDHARPVAGWVEKVLVGTPGVEFEAKLDTGADTSSIDAVDIVSETRSGQAWVNFTVVRADGERVKQSGPLVRYVRIKRVDGTTNRRPVVLLEICLGSVSRSVEVSLADRKRFNYD